MIDTQDTAGSGDFDDHEPGDVNGNVDPAYARKMKQQAQRGAPRSARGRAAATATAPSDGAQVDPNAPTAAASPEGTTQRRAPREGQGVARAPRAPRQARGPRTPRPPRSEGDAALQASVAETPNQSFDPAAPRSEFVAQASDASAANGEAVASMPTDATAANASREGHQARGPRRDRNERGGRGGRNRNDRNDRGDRNPRGESRHQPRIDGAPFSHYPPRAEGAAFTAETDAPFDGVTSAADEGFISPNPGAFGDAQRPMDRAGRRGRNRQRRQEQGPPGRPKRRVRGPLNADGEEIAPAIAPSSGLDENGERDGERLHKVLAQQGLGSRRDMEAMIAAGEVEVNGQKAHVGQVVNERDRVHVKRRKVNVKLGDDNPRIMIYHKNAGEIVSRDDPEQRDTVFDRLPRPDHGKWIAVGRLDYNTEGLMLFTTYGELANRMMHPSHEVMREYSVRVLGELTPEQEDALVDGIELDDGPARLLSLDRIDRDSDSANHWYKITLQEGRNREVRRMFEHMGLTVSRLIRTTYGIVQMPSWLKRGQFKQLDEGDVFNILESVGLRSRKKLEKAARFGGARGKLPPAGPLGPMRSATEHDAIYNGLPSDSTRSAFGGFGGPGGGARGRGPGGNNRGGRGGRAGGNTQGFDAQPAALQQQQFPGFGGASEMQAQTVGRGARGNNPRRGKRGPGGDVDGNVMPGYRAPGGGGAGAGGGAGRRGPRGVDANAAGGNKRRGGRRGAPNGPSGNRGPGGQGRPRDGVAAFDGAAPVAFGEDGQPLAMNAGVANGNSGAPREGREGRGGSRRGGRRRRGPGGRPRGDGAAQGAEQGAQNVAPAPSFPVDVD
jgi:23S rRNA pseudouridine2605 synthase